MDCTDNCRLDNVEIGLPQAKKCSGSLLINCSTHRVNDEITISGWGKTASMYENQAWLLGAGFVGCAALGTFSPLACEVFARCTGTVVHDDNPISYLNRVYYCCTCHCL